MSLDESRKKRLLYRSWHCGTRELDLMMGQFAQTHLDSLSSADLDAFESLLAAPNPDIFAWITKAAPVPPEHDNPLVARLVRDFAAQAGNRA